MQECLVNTHANSEGNDGSLYVMQGGKKGGGNQKKGGSAISDLLKPKQPFEQTEVVLQNLLLIENHRRKVGRCSLPPSPYRDCKQRSHHPVRCLQEFSLIPASSSI